MPSYQRMFFALMPHACAAWPIDIDVSFMSDGSSGKFAAERTTSSGGKVQGAEPHAPCSPRCWTGGQATEP